MKTPKIIETWTEIEDWFEANGAYQNLEDLNEGASKEKIAALEKKLRCELPRDLRESLLCHDGGGSFESYELLGVEGIARIHKLWTDLERRGQLAKKPIVDSSIRVWWIRSWIPFAEDGAGNLICVDPVTNRLLHVERQDSQGVFQERDRGFGDWLRAFAKKLRDGTLVVDPDGFVSEYTPPSIESNEPEPPRLDDALSKKLQELNDKGDVKALARLLDQEKLDGNCCISWHGTLLARAAWKRQHAIVKLLLDRGADVNFGEKHGYRTALFEAVWGRSDEKLVRTLLARNANPNSLTSFDGTSLHAAVMYDQPAVLKLLLAHGGDPSMTDAKGRTPLARANDDQQEIKKILLKASPRG